MNQIELHRLKVEATLKAFDAPSARSRAAYLDLANFYTRQLNLFRPAERFSGHVRA